MDVSFDSIAALVASNLSAAVIIALGWANVVQYKRNNQLQDKILGMAEGAGKDTKEILIDTNRITSANTEVIRRVLEGRG